MKVLVLSHMFPNELDPSSGIFVLEQVRALRKAGVEVVVVAPTPLAPRSLRIIPSVRKYMCVSRHAVVDGFTVLRPRVATLPKKHGFALSGLALYLSCRKVVQILIQDAHIDLIHAHTLLPDGFAAVLLGKHFRLPTVCTAHGSDINVYPYTSRTVHRATSWALQHVETVITVSDNLRQDATRLGCTRSIEVVHNGADGARFVAEERREARTKLGLPTAGALVGFVGYLREEKAVDCLLDSFAALDRRDAKLCIVGDGPLKPGLVRQAEQLGIADRCIFAGSQPHLEIPVWLSAFDCLVLCSLSEGLPTVLPEAMLCRVPVIVTPVGGIPEIVHDQTTGLVVPCRDIQGLTRALHAVINDSQLSHMLAHNAFKFARRSLTWDINARNTCAIYEDTLRRSFLRSHGRTPFIAPAIRPTVH